MSAVYNVLQESWDEAKKSASVTDVVPGIQPKVLSHPPHSVSVELVSEL